MMVFCLILQISWAQEFSSNELTRYASSISSMVAGRTLTAQEVSRIQSQGELGLKQVIESWMATDFFYQSVAMMVETQLGTSGQREGVNHNLPGNLARHIARRQAPVSEILTANYCVNDQGGQVACDSGAPFVAGVLTTRAFLVSNSGRFNLGRAGKMLKQFACREYPMEQEIQIPIAREKLIPMFQQREADPSGAAFGNGFACYSCHSQFAAHSQFFVKFDAFGTYQISATGLQNPELEDGRSENNLFTSHMIDPQEAASEGAQMFGKSAANIREAAAHLASSDLFWNCQTRNVLKYFLRLNSSTAEQITDRLTGDILNRARASRPEPSYQSLVSHGLLHPIVIRSVLNTGVNP